MTTISNSSDLKRLCNHEETGLHYMLLYDDIDLLRQVYCTAAKNVLENNGVLLILSYFETPPKVNYYLDSFGVDVEFYHRTDSLFIVDSVEQFFNSSAEDVVRFIELINKKAIRQGKSGVTAIIDMDALFHFDIKGQSERFESLIGPRDNQTKFRCLLCAYHKSRFDKLNEEVQNFLHNRHYFTIDKDGSISAQSI